MLSSSGREAAMFTVAGLFPLKPVMLLMPCHMLLGLLFLKCSSTLFLYVCLAALMDLLRSLVSPAKSRYRTALNFTSE